MKEFNLTKHIESTHFTLGAETLLGENLPSHVKAHVFFWVVNHPERPEYGSDWSGWLDGILSTLDLSALPDYRVLTHYSDRTIDELDASIGKALEIIAASIDQFPKQQTMFAESLTTIFLALTHASSVIEKAAIRRERLRANGAKGGQAKSTAKALASTRNIALARIRRKEKLADLADQQKNQ